MDDIEKRLREATDACITSLENWNKQGKSLESREALMETMHEVRKVIARVEIEIAISERDRLGSRPIPIPPHRSSRKSSGEDADFAEEMNAAPEMPSMRQNMGEGRPRHHAQGNRDGGRARRPMGAGGPRSGNNSPNPGNSSGNSNGNGNNDGNAGGENPA